MEFSWIMFFVPVAVVLFEGYCAWDEKTFYPNQAVGSKIKMPFILHGGVVVGDLIILPIVFGLWMSWLSVSILIWVVFFELSVIITWYCHKTWWRLNENKYGFMYPNRKFSKGSEKIWYKDLPNSAYVHFLYMVGALMLIGGYIFSPMPANVVWTTFWLFVFFVPIAIIEPGIIEGWPPTKKDIIISFGSAIFLWALLGFVTWLKLIHFWVL